MKAFKAVASLGLCLVLIGCGGGGSAKVPRYAGAWSGGVSLISNSCARRIPDEFLYISLLHNVEQATSEDFLGNTLVDIVLDDGIDTYIGVGEVDAAGDGHSFTATGTAHELPGFISGYTCIETIDFTYASIDFSTDVAGYVTRHSSITCTRGNSISTCDVTYTGSSYRSAKG